MRMTPEQIARQNIDCLFQQSGWMAQDYTVLNPSARCGTALGKVSVIRERCDYILIINRKAVGIVETRKTGATVAEQSCFYGNNLPNFLQLAGSLAFYYEFTGIETFFRVERDSSARSCRVLNFRNTRGMAPAHGRADVERGRGRAAIERGRKIGKVVSANVQHATRFHQSILPKAFTGKLT